MRLVLAAHGCDSRSPDPAERAVHALASGLAGRGHRVTLAIAHAPSEVPGCEIVQLARTDLHPEHWHKTLSPEVSAAWRALLRERAAEVAHVHHWLGLSRDLVLAAARERVPSVVTLHDAWTSCPIRSRRRTQGDVDCDDPVGALPCVPCASRAEPRAPWVPMEQSFLLVGERQRDLQRELALARARFAAGAELAARLERWLGFALDVELLDPTDLAGHERAFALAAQAGAPAVEPEAWFESRLQRETLLAWDARCAGDSEPAGA